jgi:hypothetical protein
MSLLEADLVRERLNATRAHPDGEHDYADA